MRLPRRLMELKDLNMTHHEKNYCAAIMTISTLQTDVMEREAMEYVSRKEFACIVEGIGGRFRNTRELHVIKYKK